MSFEDLGLSPETLRAVTDAGYSTPTPIQSKAIPYVLMGRDIVGVAQTGTGKTAGFTLPLIDILADGQAKARMPRALILEPTRELADQVKSSFEKYGKYHRLSTALLIGGMSFGDQDKLLDRGVDVLIATPGRLLDHFERGKVMLSGVKILVIDEADRMMDMGFIPDVERIVKLMPPLRQSLFFSATMSPEMRRLADAFLTNPKEVSVAPPASPAETVTQTRIEVANRDKRAALRQLLAQADVKNAIIFCNRKKDVDILFKSLKKHGFNAGAIHGDLSQAVRMETLDNFKTGKISLLVASDVAARGLDIQGLSHVFNFDVPMNSEDYVHRIGRTGRAGKTGRAYMLVTPSDDKFMAGIRSLIKKEIPLETLEGFEASPADADDDADRGERRSRGGRRRRDEGKSSDRSRSRKASTADEPAADEVRAEAEESAASREESATPREEKRPRRRKAAESKAAENKAAENKAAESKPADSKAAAAVAETAEAPSEGADDRQERKSASNTGKEPQAGAPQHRKNEPPSRGRRGESRRRNTRSGGERSNDGGKPVVGMGDHVPAFLMRPARRQQG
ncbi:DEAD/DEAH box helicase [Marinibaculum pumilum]|uniref:DEAD/DEAH box helicase n=1 Tax=Marinibaculum pumilum TaxID=1766165 RepID=A0ABV7KWU0_9PROT